MTEKSLELQENMFNFVHTTFTLQPAQMGAAPDHTPTALFPLAVQVLSSSPPLLSSSGGHETTYWVLVSYKKKEEF